MGSIYFGVFGLVELDGHLSPQVRKFSAVITISALSALSLSRLPLDSHNARLLLFTVSHKSCSFSSLLFILFSLWSSTSLFLMFYLPGH